MKVWGEAWAISFGVCLDNTAFAKCKRKEKNIYR